MGTGTIALPWDATFTPKTSSWINSAHAAPSFVARSRSAAGVTAGTGGAFGSLALANTGTALDGQTVNAILAIAEAALGGNPLPAGVTVTLLNELATNLNEAHDNGTRTSWASDHLIR
jgi:hypothetical protein